MARARPKGGPFTFACITCKLVLCDGVEYAWCPRCSREVDWIDGSGHVYLCGTCDTLVDGTAESLRCASCFGDLELLSPPIVTTTPGSLWSIPTVMRTVLLAAVALQALFALLDPEGFPYLAHLLGILQLAALAIVLWFVFMSRELRALARSPVTRIIHGLEHATAKVLEERGLHVLSGRTYDGRFVLDLEHEAKYWEGLGASVRTAAEDAISRIRFGERGLAYDPRCGTSLLVAIALLAFAIVAAGVIAFALPVGYAFALTVALGFLARLVARRAGLFAQRWLTVSTDFASALVVEVEQTIAPSGDVAHTTVTLDVILRARGVAAIPV